MSILSAQRDFFGASRHLSASLYATLVYTNELHDALLRKNGVEFWKCWRANFQPVNKCAEVENIVDSDVIVGKFAAHFSSSYTHNDADKAKRSYDEYKTCVLRTEALR